MIRKILQISSSLTYNLNPRNLILTSRNSSQKRDKQQIRKQLRQKLRRPEKKVKEQLSKTQQLVRQTQNLQVVSTSIISNQIIIQEIKRQRQDIFGEKQEEKKMDLETQISQSFRLRTQKTVTNLLIGLTGVNLGTAAVLLTPLFAINYYWLGAFSSALLYPSLIFTSCAAVGVNLAYLITRQTYCMFTKPQDLHQVNITYSPISYYAEMSLIFIQLMSLAASVSLPMTILTLGPVAKDIALYSSLLCLLAVNAHCTYQQKQIKNQNYKMSIQSICFAILFFLSAYIHVKYSVSEVTSDEEIKIRESFEEGQKKIRQGWKIKHSVIKDQKITDILTKQIKQQQTQQKKQDKIF